MRPFINVNTGKIIYCIRSSIRKFCAAYNFSCFNLKRPDDGSQLEPKYVSMNKLIKTSVVCDKGFLHPWCERCVYKISYKNGSDTACTSFHEVKLLGRH